MVNCAECHEEFNSEKSLHAHIKRHSLTVGGYYLKHYPKRDKLTGELIEFKTREQYFSSDFSSFTNFKKWVTTAPKDEARAYCLELLKKRKEEKGLYYPLTQVELRSLKLPPIQILESVFEKPYSEICASVGFAPRFLDVVKFKPKNNSLAGREVIVDTREQKPLDFSIPSVIGKLDYGDYALNDYEFSGNVHIERKSLQDAISTFTKGFDRFCREVELAASNEFQLVIVIEAQFSDAMSFNYLPYIARHTRATPEFFFHNIRQLINSYSNIQFLFVHGRKEAVKMIEYIFANKNISKVFDLQYLYDSKKLL